MNPHPTDMEYWTQFRFMGHITGADYNTFVTGFIPQYNTTNRFYNLFAVKTTTGAVMHSSTCFDFQVAALRFLAGAYECFVASTHPPRSHPHPACACVAIVVVPPGLPDAEFYASTLQRDNVFLHASALSPVNINDPTNRANVAAFYSLIQSMPGAVFAAWSCWTAVSRCRGSRNHPGGARLAENQHDGAVFRGRGGGDRQVRWQRVLLRPRHLLSLGPGVSIHHGVL